MGPTSGRSLWSVLWSPLLLFKDNTMAFSTINLPPEIKAHMHCWGEWLRTYNGKPQVIYYIFSCAFCFMTPAYFVDYKHSLPNHRTNCLFPHSGFWLYWLHRCWLPILFQPPLAGFVFVLPDEIAVQYDLFDIDEHIQMSKISSAELSLSSAVPWLYYCWWHLEMCIYTLAHLLLLAQILTCALISPKLISAHVKAWVFCTLMQPLCQFSKKLYPQKHIML